MRYGHRPSAICCLLFCGGCRPPVLQPFRGPICEVLVITWTPVLVQGLGPRTDGGLVLGIEGLRLHEAVFTSSRQ
jgi:hypothetical protein